MVSRVWNGLKGMEEVNVSHVTEWFVRDLFWAQPGSSGTARGKMSVGCVSKARGEVEAADRDLGSEDTKLKLCECPRKARKMGGEPGERVRRSLGTGGTDHGCERPPFVAMERIGIPTCCATRVRDPHWRCCGLCGLC